MEEIKILFNELENFKNLAKKNGVSWTPKKSKDGYLTIIANSEFLKKYNYNC